MRKGRSFLSSAGILFLSIAHSLRKIMGSVVRSVVLIWLGLWGRLFLTGERGSRSLMFPFLTYWDCSNSVYIVFWAHFLEGQGWGEGEGFHERNCWKRIRNCQKRISGNSWIYWCKMVLKSNIKIQTSGEITDAEREGIAEEQDELSIEV